jgi:hypothetical protein
MRNAAQRSLLLQDCLPADEALYGYSVVTSSESFLKALRDWERKRGILPWKEQLKAAQKARLDRKEAKPQPKSRPPKKTREELLARKREVARQRYAEMPEWRKEIERKRSRNHKLKSKQQTQNK